MKSLVIAPFLFTLLALPKTADAPRPAGEHDWTVDTGHSSVVFKVKHANAAWFKGTFDTITGAVSLDPTKPDAGSVQLTIPVESVDTNDKKRDDHLKAADFFNGKENPEITFQSTKIAAKGAMLEVTGDLAMAGKKKPITIQVEKVGEGEMYGKRVGFSTTFTIKRSDYGMTYGIDKNALGDEVTLMIDLEVLQAKK
jgi:polyisoprenoid-binding protein YceI